MINGDIKHQEKRSIATHALIKILVTFPNLTHLDFQLDNICLYPPRIPIDSLSSTSFNSSKIVYLNLRVRNFDDCIRLLDGRFSQLHTLIINIDEIKYSSLTFNDMVKYFNICFKDKRIEC
jgi:hypothetical protein